jgi:hypothetical protein
MRFTTKTTCLSLIAVLLIASLALAQGTEGHKDHRNGPRTGPRARVHARMERRAHIREFVRAMAFSDTQKAQALQAARTVQPIAEAARSEAKQIVQAARSANPTGTREQIRAAVKDQVKAVRERAATQVLPSGRALLASRTPEQRAKIQERLAKHGKTFDEEKVARRLGFLLSRPGAVKFLESRTGPRTQR